MEDRAMTTQTAERRTNEDRAQTALRVIEFYQAETGAGDTNTALSDLLADLQHLCAAESVSFLNALERANMYYDAEVDDCDECGETIPSSESSMANKYHAESCSLYEGEATDNDEPQEPEEGDITTSDHELFYQYGKLWLTVPLAQYSTFKKGEQIMETSDERMDWRKAVQSQMERDQFWPNVWFISDHGNVRLLSLSE
jgi:hypothetical protein